MSRGIYVTPTEFVSFAETRQRSSLSEQIATRERSMDMSFGFILPNPDPILKRQGKDIAVYRDMRSRASVGGPIRRRKAAVKALEWRVERGKASARVTRLANDVLATYDMDTLINEITNAVLFGYQPLELVWGPFNGAAAPPRKFLLARQEASYDNPYGFADLSMCFWADTFMRGGLKFWVTFTEKYGTPWLVGKQPRGTPGSEVNNLLDKLEAMVQDAVAAIPDDSSIDILESGDKGASADLYERLLMYCRSEINIALLGQNQSTESNSNRASATAGLEVAKTIRDGDSALVMATMNQLLRWLTDLHDGEQAPAPTFVLFEEEDVNTQQAVRDETLTKAGVKFTKEYWKRVYRLQDGDIEEAPAGPSMPKAPGAAAAVPVEFVEGSAPAAVPAGELSTAAAPIVMAWVRDLRALVEAHSEPQALQDALLEAYSELPTDELTEVMALAFELAHLQGRDEVAQGAGRG